MDHDKMIIEVANSQIPIELPEYGSLTVHVQAGKVVRTEMIISEKWTGPTATARWSKELPNKK